MGLSPLPFQHGHWAPPAAEALVSCAIAESLCYTMIEVGPPHFSMKVPVQTCVGEALLFKSVEKASIKLVTVLSSCAWWPVPRS
eukprot:1141280-Pelagomonas_calceolata.AAC.2